MHEAVTGSLLVSFMVLDPSTADRRPSHVASPDWATAYPDSGSLLFLSKTKHLNLSSSVFAARCDIFPTKYRTDPSFHSPKHESSSTRDSEPPMSAQAWNRNRRWDSSVQVSIEDMGSRHSPCPLKYENLNGPLKGQATGPVFTIFMSSSEKLVSVESMRGSDVRISAHPK